MRVSLGFEPAWFHKRCGVDITERWHKDALYRCESLKKMKAELVKAFPSVVYWDLSCEDDLAKISGCYGAYVIAQVFGLPLRYAPDRWPVPEPGRTLSIGAIENLDVEMLLQGPLVEELFGQMDIIESKWGKIHGYLNWQGVLNNAFQISETRRAVMYWPTKFQDASIEELRRDMEKIYRELSPCDIVMADIQYSTPDTRIQELIEICRGLESAGKR